MRASSPATRMSSSSGGRLARTSSSGSVSAAKEQQNANASQNIASKKTGAGGASGLAIAINESTMNKSMNLSMLNSSQMTSATDQNIRVAARIRPKTPREASSGTSIFVNEKGNSNTSIIDGAWPSEMLIVSNSAITHNAKQRFRFDSVFPETASQESVFEEMAAPLVRAVCSGYNAALFAYGQTGTGKTHTMLGEDIWMLASRKELSVNQRDVLEHSEMRGVIPRAMHLLFSLLRDKPHKVSVSYLEIYNEKILDLLNDASTGSLEIREDKQGNVQVCDAIVKRVSSTQEVFDQLWKGARNRAVSSTDMNEHSSRSHTIFQVLVETKGQGNIPGTKAKLNLVDLAGSEKWRPHQLSEFSDQRIAEMTSINQSLSNLGNCVRGLLRPGGSKHIPFRNSKLTRLLQDSLGGSSQCGFVVTVSPSELAHEETISTLQFADRVKRVQVKADVNLVETPESLLKKLEVELNKAREENAALRQQVESLASVKTIPSNKSLKPELDYDEPVATKQLVPSNGSRFMNNISNLIQKCVRTASSNVSIAEGESLGLLNPNELNTYLEHLRSRKSDALEPSERLALVEWALTIQQQAMDRYLAESSNKENGFTLHVNELQAKLAQQEQDFKSKVQTKDQELLKCGEDKLKLQQEVVNLKSRLLDVELANNRLSVPSSSSSVSQSRRHTLSSPSITFDEKRRNTESPDDLFASSSRRDVMNEPSHSRSVTIDPTVHYSSRRGSISDDVLRVEGSSLTKRPSSSNFSFNAPPPPPLSSGSSNGKSYSEQVIIVNPSSSNMSNSSSSFALGTPRGLGRTFVPSNQALPNNVIPTRPISQSQAGPASPSISSKSLDPSSMNRPSSTPSSSRASVSSMSTPGRQFNSSRASQGVASVSKPSSSNNDQKVQVWDRFVDNSTGRFYFHCKETGETTWRRPVTDDAAVVIVRGE